MKSISRSIRIIVSVATLSLFSVCAEIAAQTTNTFPNTGNVGIGTTSPSATLEVNKSQNGQTNLYVLNGTSGTAASALVLFGEQPSDGHYSYFGHFSRSYSPGSATFAEPGSFGMFGGSDGNVNVVANNNKKFQVWTTPDNGANWAVRLAVDGAGNVGIGTTSPVFDVNGSVSKYFAMDAGAGSLASFGVGSNITNTSYPVGQVAFFNSSLGTTEKRLATIVGQTTNATNNGALAFWTANSGSFVTPTMFMTANHVGIGNLNPAVSLDIKGDNVSYGGQIRIAAADYDQLSFYNSNDLTLGANGRRGSLYYALASNKLDLNNNVSGAPIVLQDPLDSGGGNVGIGILPNANYKLDVAGNINSSATITGNNIVAKYQDVAEWVPSSQQLAAGTVVVLDSTKSNEVIASTEAYDTRVAGVISAQPGITLGEKSDNKVLVATTGRVRVKVDATKSPITIGDLLVTSDIPGVAMKSEAVNLGGIQMHRPGTIIGKALEPLAKGSGEILVLLSLQ